MPYLCIGIAAPCDADKPVPRYALSVATVTESGNRIRIASLSDANLGQQRTHICLICRLENAIGPEHITNPLRLAQCCAVHQLCFSIGSLDVEDALDHCLNLGFDIV